MARYHLLIDVTNCLYEEYHFTVKKLGRNVNMAWSLLPMSSKICSTDSQQSAKACKLINNIIMWG